MQNAKEDVKEGLRKATHPFNAEKKAEDHAQAEAAKAQHTENRAAQRVENHNRSTDPQLTDQSLSAGDRPGDAPVRNNDPGNSPALQAENYQPSSVDQPSGGVKGALKKAVNKMTPGEGTAGPNAAMTQGAGSGAAFGNAGNIA